MPTLCELCGTELGSRDGVCGVCGTKSGQATTLVSGVTDTGSPFPAPVGRMPDTFPVTPQALTPGQPRRDYVGIASKCLVATAVVGVLGWGAARLWWMGPGGAIAYDQHNRAGNAAFGRADFTTADMEYSEMIALQPGRADGYLLRAINDYKEGQYPQAVRDNTAALALTSGLMPRANIYFNRAQSYFNRKAWADAVADYTASEQAYQQASSLPGADTQDVERMPRWLADVRRGRARANLELKNYAPTYADYTANIEAGTVLPEDYGMRGAAQEGLGHDTEAVADYGTSLCMDAGYLYAGQKIDGVVTRTHRYSQAVAAYQKAVEAHPESAQFWGSLGWYQYMAGHLDAAITADERALSLDPAQSWIRSNLGLSRAVTGDSDRASKAYAAALADPSQLNPSGPLKELHEALAQHPGSPSLQAALKQVGQIVANSSHTHIPIANNAAASPAVDARFEKLLDAQTTLRGGSIRPPSGYTLTQKRGASLSGEQDVALWRGAARPDGSAPDLEVTISSDDGRAAAQSTPRQMMQQYLEMLASNHAPFKASAITTCTMGTQTFLKVTWSGAGVKTGRQFSGFVYLSSRTGEYITLFAHDAAPHSATSLPLLEASARTFRR